MGATISAGAPPSFLNFLFLIFLISRFHEQKYPCLTSHALTSYFFLLLTSLFSYPPHIQHDIAGHYQQEGDIGAALAAVGKEVGYLVGYQNVEQGDIESEIVEVQEGEYRGGTEKQCKETVESPHTRIVAQDFQKVGDHEDYTQYDGDAGGDKSLHHIGRIKHRPGRSEKRRLRRLQKRLRLHNSETEYNPCRGDKSKQRG